MARFLYKGKDVTGSVRSGTLDAPNYAEARKTLQAQGIQVSMLNQTTEPRESTGPTIAPPVPTEEPERRFGIKRLIVPVILLVGVVALGLWALPRLKGRTAPTNGQGLKPGEVTRAVAMRGQVELLGTPSGARPDDLLKDVRITVIFPDVPTELTLYYPELHMTSSGGFDTKLYFLSPNDPGEANVTVRMSGFETSRQTNLAVKKSGELYELVVPRATMQARKGFLPPAPGQDEGPGGDEDEATED